MNQTSKGRPKDGEHTVSKFVRILDERPLPSSIVAQCDTAEALELAHVANKASVESGEKGSFHDYVG